MNLTYQPTDLGMIGSYHKLCHKLMVPCWWSCYFLMAILGDRWSNIPTMNWQTVWFQIGWSKPALYWCNWSMSTSLLNKIESTTWTVPVNIPFFLTEGCFIFPIPVFAASTCILLVYISGPGWLILRDSPHLSEESQKIFGTLVHLIFCWFISLMSVNWSQKCLLISDKYR